MFEALAREARETLNKIFWIENKSGILGVSIIAFIFYSLVLRGENLEDVGLLFVTAVMSLLFGFFFHLFPLVLYALVDLVKACLSLLRRLIK